jgi:hypothetical protein
MRGPDVSGVLGAAALAVYACGGDPDLPYAATDAAAPSDGPSTEGEGPDVSAPFDGNVGFGCTGASPSFSRGVTPIFLGNCAGRECHLGGFSYTRLVNAPSLFEACSTARILVFPCSLEKSYLMHKLTGLDMCPSSLPMPASGRLPSVEIQTIADWICAGAQND